MLENLLRRKVIGIKWKEVNGAKPLVGGAKLYCAYGGEIEIVTSGQPE